MLYVLTFVGWDTMGRYVCLDNACHGLFVTTKENEKWHLEETNPRVSEITEFRILSAFVKAKFTVRNSELTMAETENFNFRLFTEDIEDDIYWVEPKDNTYSNSNPY